MGVFDKAKDKVEDLAKDRMGGNKHESGQNKDENQPGGGLRDKAEDAMQDVRDRFNNRDS